MQGVLLSLIHSCQSLLMEAGTAVEPPLKEWEGWSRTSIKRALARRRQAQRLELGIRPCRCAHGCQCWQSTGVEDSAGGASTEPDCSAGSALPEPAASRPLPKLVPRMKAVARPPLPQPPPPTQPESAGATTEQTEATQMGEASSGKKMKVKLNTHNLRFTT